MWWQKAMIHLGLGDDEDAFADEAEDEPERAPARDHRHGGRQRPQGGGAPAGPGAGSGSFGGLPVTAPSAYPDEPSAIGTVRPITPRDGGAEGEPGPGQTFQPTGQSIRPRPQVVRPVAVTANARPQIVVATSFNQAQHVADKFKSSQPVIMNLQDADRELSRRLIDFASGLCYGLGGQMEKVANQVYLLTPANVEVSPDERRRLKERGYDA